MAKRKRGRPKGTYTWTPEKWGTFWDDAHAAVQLIEDEGSKPSRRRIAQWLSEAGWGEPETIRQILQAHAKPCKTHHGTGEKYRTRTERDAIDAAVWKVLLGEEEN